MGWDRVFSGFPFLLSCLFFSLNSESNPTFLYLSTNPTFPYLSTNPTFPYLSTNPTFSYLSTNPPFLTFQPILLSLPFNQSSFPYLSTNQTIPYLSTNPPFLTIKKWVFATNSNFRILISLQPNVRQSFLILTTWQHTP